MARLPKFPQQFLFGVAIADHQSEAYVQGLDDIWDDWERQPHRHPVTPRGRATDFWQRYAGDIKLAQEMGCTAFRLSVAWARVEPTPGAYDEAALEHYREVCRTIRQAGMQPIVTLLHFVWPLHVEARGGLTADDFPELFARYAETVARCLHEEVRYWVPFNEPGQLVYGFVKPFWEPEYFSPPGLPGATLPEQMEAIRRLIRNLFLAHKAAREAIHKIDGTALVGSNPFVLGIPPFLQRLVNWLVTRRLTAQSLMQQGARVTEGTLLGRGAADMVIATLTATEPRAQQVSFSDVYYVAGQRLLVKAGSPVHSAAGLAGRPVAAVRGSTAAARGAELLPGAAIRIVENYPAALAALDADQVAALLADDTILAGLVEQAPDRYRLVEGEPLTREPYAVAVTPGSRELLDHVNAALQKFAARDRLASGEPSAPPATALAGVSRSPLAQAARARLAAGGPLPPAEPGTILRRIQDRGYLVVAVKDDVPGFGYRDPQTGAYRGLEIDLAREIARQVLGDPDKVQFRATPTAQRIRAVRSFWQIFDPVVKPLSVLSTLFYADWWHLGMAGRLPDYLCPKGCEGQEDFASLDYYWGLPALRLDRLWGLLQSGANRMYTQAPVWPGGLYSLLRFYAGLFPGRPILILENGSVPVTDGERRLPRKDYIRRHVREVQRALSQGVPVQAYICWSITTNREWGAPTGPGSDFGLYHIDLDSEALERVPTPDVDAYQGIITGRSADADGGGV